MWWAPRVAYSLDLDRVASSGGDAPRAATRYAGLVKAVLSLPSRATYADYLAAEQNSDCRHEFIDGVIPRSSAASQSEGDDEGAKRRDFQSLASLQAYVIAAQNARQAKVHRRNERGEWGDEPYVYRNGESFELPTLTARDRGR